MMNKQQFNVKLTKLESSHNNLRTNEVVGKCFRLPEINDSFFMWGEGLEIPGSTRNVTTSLIQSVEKIAENKLQFNTLNSKYSLEIL